MNENSFLTQVRNELSRAPGDSCCRKAEIHALLRALGTLLLPGSGGPPALQIRALRVAPVRRLVALLKAASHVDPVPGGGPHASLEIATVSDHRLGRDHWTQVTLDAPATADLLALLGTRLEELVSPRPLPLGTLLEKRCCGAAFLRGVFLAAGFVDDPTHAYAVEFYLATERDARDVRRLLSRLFPSQKPALRDERNGRFTVSLRSAAALADFLSLVGAPLSLLRLENLRSLRDTRTEINRLVNAETANSDRAMNTAVSTINQIKALMRWSVLENLPATLQRVARLRLAHPEASLAALGAMLDPARSKSAVNGALRRISAIYWDEVRKGGDRKPIKRPKRAASS